MKKNIFIFVWGVFMTLAAGCGNTNDSIIEDVPDVPELPGANGNGTGEINTRDIEFTRSEKDDNEGLNSFSMEFFSEFLKTHGPETFKEGNCAVSPVSLEIALGMLANSVEDEKAAKICDVMGCRDMEILNSVLLKLAEYLPERFNGASMYMANAVWYSPEINILEVWEETMNRLFSAEVNELDFTSPYALRVVNDWIAEHTENEIRDFLNGIPELTKVMIANALYYAGEWSVKFDKNLTEEGVFHGLLGDIRTQFMKCERLLEYADNDNFEMVKLPFDGLNSLVVVLPKAGEDLAGVAEKLAEGNLATNGFLAKEAKVTLSLPKFAVDCRTDVDDVLADMGIPVNNLQFSKMDAKNKLSLNLFAKTGATTTIDEDGAKLAAVTVLGMCTASGITVEPEKVTMTVDRPFLYFVVNGSSHSIIMAGAVGSASQLPF